MTPTLKAKLREELGSLTSDAKLERIYRAVLEGKEDHMASRDHAHTADIALEEWVRLPRELTPELLKAARMASLGTDPFDGDPIPVWDNWDSLGNSEHDKAYWRAVTGFEPTHASYDWPHWQEAVLAACYRAIIAAVESSAKQVVGDRSRDEPLLSQGEAVE